MYKYDFIINFSNVDRNYNIRLKSLQQMTMDTATIHSDKLGFSPMYLAERDLAWVIYESKINLTKTDLYAHKISIETFTIPKKNIFFTRYFIIYDEDGSVIGTAMSKWVVIDLKKRSIAKIPSEMIEKFNENIQIDSEQKKKLTEQKFDKIQNNGQLKEKFYDIRYFDIDPSRHVNNTVYIEWGQESISDDDFFDSHKIISASVVYKKECPYYKKQVKVRYNRGENESYQEIYDDEDNLLALIKLGYDII